jgi:acetyl esterase
MTDAQPYVRPDVAQFLAFLESSGGPELTSLPLPEARTGYVALGTMAEADPRPLAVIRDLACPGPAGPIPLRLYDRRESRAAGPVVVFFHGGGWVIGDLESHHAFCTEIAAEMDLPVVAVDYRLAPEHPFPAAHLDCEAVARWVADSPAELGRPATGLIPLGDSAGGNLTIAVSQALTARPAAVPVLLQVPIYPVTDDSSDGSFIEFAEGYLLSKNGMDWFFECYAPAAGSPLVFPLYGEHAGTPPTLLVTAGLDPLRDQGRRYGAALVQAGIDVTFLEMTGSIHGFVTLRKAIPSAQADTHAIFAAMRLMLGKVSA